MTSPPKPKRRKPPEALDWRELAQAPALRGLSEVLSPVLESPPEVLPPTAVLPTSGGRTPTAAFTTSVGAPPAPAAEWVDAGGKRYEAKRVRPVTVARHSLALGEERVYQSLWQAGESDGVTAESDRSKTFSLGYDRIARLVRLNEKSVRMLMPKLIAKKVLEVVAPEHSASRLGRTYRIFSDDEILLRQRAANLTDVVRAGRAVEFVWPYRPR